MPTDDDLDQVLDPNIREELKRARKREQEFQELQERLNATERASALDKAGLPETGAGKFFRDHYDGPLDVASIKAAAEEAGIVAAAAAPPARDPAIEAELETQRLLAGGIRGQGDGEVDPVETYEAELKAARREFNAHPGDPVAQLKASERVKQALADLQAAGGPVRLKVQGDEE